MLLSYEKYTEMGGTLPENQFLLYENLSEAELKAIANGALPDTPTVESCMLLMIDAYEKSDNMPAESRATGFSNDGVSVSLAVTETSESILETARNRIAMLFSNAGIRKFLGVRHRE